MARLGDVATYINGYAFKPTDWSDEGIPIIRIQDLTGNSYQANRLKGNYDTKYEVNCGDVLISWSASLGVYVWTGEKAVLNQHIFKVQFDKVEVDKNFFVHQVERILNNASGEAHGATMKHLTKPVFDSLPFYLPNIEEQKKIANELNKVSNLISLRKQQLSKLDELVKARFVELFGDPIINPKGFPIRTIDEIAILNKGITYAPEDVTDEGMIVLRSSNIKGNVFDLTDLVKIKKEISPEKFVHENDILMCNRNGSARLVGKVAMIPKLEENMTFGTFMTIVRSDIYNYLFTFFQTDAFREQIKFQTAVAINQISLPLLASVKVPLPPQELIDEFSIFTKQTDKSKFEIQKSLEKLETLKKALMQKYFG